MAAEMAQTKVYATLVFNPVEFYFEVQCGRLDVQQSGRRGLVTPATLQGKLYEIDFKVHNLVIEVDALGNIKRTQLIRLFGEGFVGC